MQFNYNGHSKESGIYTITNILNGRIYIGSCKKFKTRWDGHKRDLLAKKHHSKFLQNDYDKCVNLTGDDEFLKFDIVEVTICDLQERLRREEMYIIHYLNEPQNCYNMRKSAVSREGVKTKENSRFLHAEKLKKKWKEDKEFIERMYKIRNSKEYRNLQSESAKKQWQNADIRALITEKTRIRCNMDAAKKIVGERTKNLWNDEDYRTRVINKSKEIKNTVENKKKYSEAAHAQWQNPEIRQRMLEKRISRLKKYNVISPTGQEIVISNVGIFCKEYSLCRRSFDDLLHERCETYKGWKLIKYNQVESSQ